MFLKKLRRSRAAVVGVCCALVGAAAVPVISLAGSITGSTGDGPMVLESGASTLTYAGRANVSSIPVAEQALWSRVGDTVQQSGVIGVNPTTSGATTSVYIPTAVDSNLDGNHCQGVATVTSPSVATARVLAPTTAGHTHQCFVEYQTTSTGTQYIYYNMLYRVKD